jgi:hypothetical protein
LIDLAAIALDPRQVALRKPPSPPTGTTVTSREFDPSGFGPTLITTCLFAFDSKKL